MTDVQEVNEQKRKAFGALRENKSAEEFLAYWQKEGEVARQLSKKVAAVMTGATPVSEEVIAECKQAVLRLNQIAFVLGNLTFRCVGDGTEASIQVLHEHEKLARTARENVDLMMKWSVGRLPPDN